MAECQELDDRLFEIEGMVSEERQLHAEEESVLITRIEELRVRNNPIQARFEQLRNEYFAQYGVPSVP